MDFVVVTASTPAQAASYRALVGARVASGVYPSHIHFRFYCDPPGGRVGSGGGTMLALAQLLAEEACGEDGQRPAAVGQQAAVDFFSARRILLVHAGGESRRLPCYVPEGKLFAPLLLACATSEPPTVLDVLLTLYTSYPWAKGETMVCSGDVIVHFNVTQTLPAGFKRGDLCGFGVAAPLEQGARHGVFGCPGFGQAAPSGPPAGISAACLGGSFGCAAIAPTAATIAAAPDLPVAAGGPPTGISTASRGDSISGTTPAATSGMAEAISVPMAEFFQKAPVETLRARAALPAASILRPSFSSPSILRPSIPSLPISGASIPGESVPGASIAGVSMPGASNPGASIPGAPISGGEACAVDTGIFSLSPRAVCTLLGWATGGWAGGIQDGEAAAGATGGWAEGVGEGVEEGEAAAGSETASMGAETAEAAAASAGVAGAGAGTEAAASAAGVAEAEAAAAAAGAGDAAGGAQGVRAATGPAGSAEMGRFPSPSVLQRVRSAVLYFDFYLEVVTAALPGVSAGAYVQRMQEGGSKLPLALLTSLHAALSPLELRSVLLPHATFLHFGSLSEYAPIPLPPPPPLSRLPLSLLSSLHAALSPLELRAVLLPHATFLHFGSLSEYASAVAAVAALQLQPFYAKQAPLEREEPAPEGVRERGVGNGGESRLATADRVDCEFGDTKYSGTHTAAPPPANAPLAPATVSASPLLELNCAGCVWSLPDNKTEHKTGAEVQGKSENTSKIKIGHQSPNRTENKAARRSAVYVEMCEGAHVTFAPDQPPTTASLTIPPFSAPQPATPPHAPVPAFAPPPAPAPATAAPPAPTPSLVVGLRSVPGLACWPLPPGISLDGRDLATLPPGICRDHATGDSSPGYIVLAYGCHDSFKRSPSLRALVFCGVPIVEWLNARGLEPRHLWTEIELRAEAAGEGIELWHARLFPVASPHSILPRTPELSSLAAPHSVFSSAAQHSTAPPQGISPPEPRPTSTSDAPHSICPHEPYHTSAFEATFGWLVAGLYSTAAAATPCEGCGRWAEGFLRCPRVSIAEANAGSSATQRDERRRQLRAGGGGAFRGSSRLECWRIETKPEILFLGIDGSLNSP